MKRDRRAARKGIILLNVLAILAVASSVVVLMEVLQEISIARSTRIGESAEADAIARGGEAAALAALRRTGIQNPGSIDYTQAWARLDETDAPIFGGRFTMRITDAQARFNINLLAHPNLLALAHLHRIASALDLPPGIAEAIAARLLIVGAVSRLSDLAGLGIDRAAIIKLSTLTIALPEDARSVNLNTADEVLIGILLGNPGAARQLVARRERQGKLTLEDLAAARVLAPADTSVSSNYFITDITVIFGDTTEYLSSLLALKHNRKGISANVIDRTRTPSMPINTDHLSP